MKPEKCKGCPLIDAPGPVWGDGPERVEMMLVGEAPWIEEVGAGRGFVGPAGRVLWVAAKAAGIRREDVYVTNAVKCQPLRQKDGSVTPSREAVEFCTRVWLDDEIRAHAPRVIVPIGGVAFEAITGRKGILEWRGSVLQGEEK